MDISTITNMLVGNFSLPETATTTATTIIIAYRYISKLKKRIDVLERDLKDKADQAEFAKVDIQLEDRFIALDEKVCDLKETLIKIEERIYEICSLI